MPSLCNIHYKIEIYGNLDRVSTILRHESSFGRSPGRAFGTVAEGAIDRHSAGRDSDFAILFQRGHFASSRGLLFYYRLTLNSPGLRGQAGDCKVDPPLIWLNQDSQD